MRKTERIRLHTQNKWSGIASRSLSGYKWNCHEFLTQRVCKLSPRIWIHLDERVREIKLLNTLGHQNGGGWRGWAGPANKQVMAAALGIIGCVGRDSSRRILTFFPSSSCVPCANTLSTLFGSPNVMKPKPLQVKEKRNRQKHSMKITFVRHSVKSNCM